MDQTPTPTRLRRNVMWALVLSWGVVLPGVGATALVSITAVADRQPFEPNNGDWGGGLLFVLIVLVLVGVLALAVLVAAIVATAKWRRRGGSTNELWTVIAVLVLGPFVTFTALIEAANALGL